MIIKLPWIDPIDTLNLPEDFDELVTKSFHEAGIVTAWMPLPEPYKEQKDDI